MRYEAGDCTIVISMKRAFKPCPGNDFYCRSHFCQKSHWTKGYNPWVFLDFGSKFNLQQNWHHWNAPFKLITMVQIPASYLIPSPRYLASIVYLAFLAEMALQSSYRTRVLFLPIIPPHIVTYHLTLTSHTITLTSHHHTQSPHTPSHSPHTPSQYHFTKLQMHEKPCEQTWGRVLEPWTTFTLIHTPSRHRTITLPPHTLPQILWRY